jgi:hypothetical protein
LESVSKRLEKEVTMEKKQYSYRYAPLKSLFELSSEESSNNLLKLYIAVDALEMVKRYVNQTNNTDWIVNVVEDALRKIGIEKINHFEDDFPSSNGDEA